MPDTEGAGRIMSDPVIARLTQEIADLRRRLDACEMTFGTVRQVSPLRVQLDADTNAAGSPATKSVTVGALTVGQRVGVRVYGGVDRLVDLRLT